MCRGANGNVAKIDYFFDSDEEIMAATLPADMLICIARFLSVADLLSFRAVCVAWKSAAMFHGLWADKTIRIRPPKPWKYIRQHPAWDSGATIDFNGLDGLSFALVYGPFIGARNKLLGVQKDMVEDVCYSCSRVKRKRTCGGCREVKCSCKFEWIEDLEISGCLPCVSDTSYKCERCGKYNNSNHQCRTCKRYYCHNCVSEPCKYCATR